MPDTDLGYRVMRKNTIYAIVAIVMSTTAIVGLSSFTSQVESSIEAKSDVHTHVSCQGKHCTYTVGCDCSGFSPKTDGKEWEKSYCKRCGHHKKYHK